MGAEASSLDANHLTDYDTSLHAISSKITACAHDATHSHGHHNNVSFLDTSTDVLPALLPCRSGVVNVGHHPPHQSSFLFNFLFKGGDTKEACKKIDEAYQAVSSVVEKTYYADANTPQQHLFQIHCEGCKNSATHLMEAKGEIECGGQSSTTTA